MESSVQLEEKRSALIRTGENIIDRALRESRALRPGEEVDLEGIETKIDTIDRTLRRANTFGRDRGEAGMLFARCALALASSGGKPSSALAGSAGRRDRDVERALSAGVATGGGFAVSTPLAQDFIEARRPRVAVRRIGPRLVPLDRGTMSITRVTAGSTTAYTHENVDTRANQPSTGLVRLVAKKTVATVPVSNDLLRYASNAAELVREDMVAAAATAEDSAFLRGDGTQETIRGLRSWATNIFTANSTVDTTHIDADLAALEGALFTANVPMVRPAWIMSTRTATFLQALRNPTSGVRSYPELDAGLLRGKPAVATTGVPVNLGTGSTAGEIYLVDASEIIVSDWPPIIDAASKGTYVDAAGNTVSAFSNDQTVIRLILQSDLVLRHDAACAVLTGVNY